MNTDTLYRRWRRRHRAILDEISSKPVVVMYSGGKDSSAALHLFARAARDDGLDIQVHAAAFPVHRYPDDLRARLDGYWRRRGLFIHWHAPAASDDLLEEESGPCGACQRIRKSVLVEQLQKNADIREPAALVIAFSLWDLVSYTLEHLLAVTMAGGEPDAAAKARMAEVAGRFFPLQHLPGGHVVFRPMLRFNDGDIRCILASEATPVVDIPCRWAHARPKRIFDAYYRQAGLRFDYDSVLSLARSVIDFSEVETASGRPVDAFFKEHF